MKLKDRKSLSIEQKREIRREAARVMGEKLKQEQANKADQSEKQKESIEEEQK